MGEDFYPWTDADGVAAVEQSGHGRACGYCGGQLTGRAGQKYCSAVCRAAAHRDRNPKPVVTHICVECGETFIHRKPRPISEWFGNEPAITLGNLARSDAVYCSNACKQANWRKYGYAEDGTWEAERREQRDEAFADLLWAFTHADDEDEDDFDDEDDF